MAKKPNPEQPQIDALNRKLEGLRRELWEMQQPGQFAPFKRQQLIRDEMYAVKRRIQSLENYK